MTEEEAINRVVMALQQRQPDADWNATDLLRVPNILTVIRVVLALKENP